MNNQHVWSDPPYSFCQICGMPNLLEIAVRRFDYVVHSDKWRSEEVKKQYEDLFLSCPISEEEYEALTEFAYSFKDETQIEIL